MPGTRYDSHAGSWYTRSASKLSSELDDFLSRVPEEVDESSLPIEGARVIIAPHAGYSYSGPCAAWAYKVFDLSAAKRVFILGPSHTYYLAGCSISTFTSYATPFGDLRIDQLTYADLAATGQFLDIPPHCDEDEHSLEMHLPYLAKRLTQDLGSDTSKWPSIVPILVGDLRRDPEKMFGEFLLPYLRDPENAFIVSSDFCHWGLRFRYTAYIPSPGGVATVTAGNSGSVAATAGPFHESIRAIDQQAIDAIESGSHDAFLANLEKTANTVCGRHPIGVMMAAMEMLRKERREDGGGGGAKKGDGVFTFVNYDRSSLVENINDSSVSYAAAYAIV